jgi:hypothetical protein
MPGGNRMKNQNISDITLERYILKELPEERIVEIDSLCSRSSELKTRIEAIKSSNEEILNSYPEEKIAAEIKAKYNILKPGKKISGRSSKQNIRRYIFPVLTVAAAAFLFFILPAIKTSFNDLSINVPGDITRQKGDEAVIYLYRKTNNAVDNLISGSIAKSGDLLQIAYVSKTDKYGVIFSIDGRGTVTLHFPESNTASTKLITGKKISLNNSYELDDAPDFEKFILITSGSNLDVDTILNTAHKFAGNRENAAGKEIELSDLKQKYNQASIKIIKAKQK